MRKKIKKFNNQKLFKKSFWEQDLSDSQFLNMKIQNCVFTDANLSNSKFINSQIKNTNLTHSNLKGVDFKSSNLLNVNLRDAIYNNQTRWPKNFNPDKYGAIKSKYFNPFSYKRKLSYKTIKTISSKEISFYKKDVMKKKFSIKFNNIERKIIKELTTGKGYIVINGYYNKKLIDKAEKIIDKKLKKHKGYKKATSCFEIDKIKKSINFFDLLNTDKIFTKMIQPKIVMNAFKKLMGERFICTYYAAQCSVAGSRGQSLHLDYPYVSYNKPGDKIPIGMGSKDFLLSCGILTYLNDANKDNYGPIVLKGSQKFRRFPTIEDVKKYEFTKIKVPKGGMLILNTLMWHAGAPNYSEISDRHLLVAHYTPDFVKLRMNLKNDLNKNVLINDKKNKGILSQLLA